MVDSHEVPVNPVWFINVVVNVASVETTVIGSLLPPVTAFHVKVGVSETAVALLVGATKIGAGNNVQKFHTADHSTCLCYVLSTYTPIILSIILQAV